MSFAGAFDLKVADSSLRVNGRKTKRCLADIRSNALDIVSHGKLPMLLVSKVGVDRGAFVEVTNQLSTKRLLSCLM